MGGTIACAEALTEARGIKKTQWSICISLLPCFRVSREVSSSFLPYSPTTMMFCYIAHEANLPQPELSETGSPKKPLTFFAQSDEQNNRHTGKSKHLHWKDAKSPCWLVTETEGQASYCHKEGIHKIQVPYASVNKELWWNFQILKKPWTTKKVALN